MNGWFRQSLHRVRSLFRSAEDDRELDAEIAAHLAFATEENLSRGLSPSEARRQAFMSFGGPQQAKEQHREARGLPFLDALFQDLRFSLRMLRKSPGFTAVAVLTLAVGIGATTAIFSVVYGVLLRPLPYRNPNQIVRLWEQNANGNRMNFADLNFEDLRSQNHSLQGLAEYRYGLETVTGATQPSRTMIASVSRDFLSIMGVQPVLGREFAPEEQQFGAPAVALVSYGYWKQSLGGQKDLSSLHLKVGNQLDSVIGVLPPGFRFPDNTDIWLPREILDRQPNRTAHNWNVIGRLRDGSTLGETRAELAAIARRIRQQFGNEDALTDYALVTVAFEPLREAMTGNARPALVILLAASGFLLLIACANVVNLMLAQAAARERELSIRSALGAKRSRLIRQFLTESLLISLLGGAFGVLLAYLGLNGLLALAPANIPRLENVSMNLYVLLFSLGTVFVVSMSLGILTALRAVSKRASSGLTEESRGQTATLRKQRLGRVLSAAQLATALVLLVGAGLLGRSLLRVLSMNSGFRTERVLAIDLAVPPSPEKSQRIQFLNRLFGQLRAVPGIEEIGGASILPLSGSSFADGAYVLMDPRQITPHMQELIQRLVNGNLEKDPALVAEFSNFFDAVFKDKERLGEADYVVATEGFFRSLGIPLLKGRLFDDRDSMDAPHAALISQSLAAEKWPKQDPTGRTIEFGNMDGDLRLLTVIGVVGDVRDRSLEVPPHPTIYVNYRQRPNTLREFSIVIRTSAEPDAVFAAARKIVHDLDPNIPPRFRTLSQVYSASVETRRFSLTLVGVFSLTALILAMAGIYGVISYSVAQRVREIGVRMALGASGREVLGMVLRQGALTSAIGVVFGILGSFVLSRWIQSQLFGVSATDPLTFVVAAVLPATVALLASYIPARRAMRVNPMVALRYE